MFCVLGDRNLGTLGAAALSVVAVACLAVGVTASWRADATRAGSTRAHVAPTPMRRMFRDDLDSLISSIEALRASVAKPRQDAAQAAFRRARAAYKHVEFLLAYYSPTTAAALTGPLDNDDPDGPPAPLGTRAGFGLVEAALFGASRRTTAMDAQEQRVTASMRASARALSASVELLSIDDSSALDAMRLELARVMTTGIAGYDSDESGDAIVESAAALDGIRAGLAHLTTALAAPERARAIELVDRAARALRASPQFDGFDRFGFIATNGIPAARAVAALRRRIDPRPPALRRLWRSSAATPFDSDAFDPSALAPAYAPPASPELIAFGRKLFFDSRLSGPGTRSCASCHAPSNAFAEPRGRATPLPGIRTAPLRNTPTLLNAALQPALFADERAGSLEEQIRVVLSSPAEMGSSPELAASRSGVDERTVRVALAAYIRTLTALSSRFDRAIRGDTALLAPDERRGFNLFVGRARCGTCHFAPLFGGTLPPEFVRSELEIIGAPSSPAVRRATVDADSGRARVDHWPEHRYAFRVPTVRNAALTAPYMHNGVYSTLAAVIDFYDRGGGVGVGASLSSQTLPSRSLHLTSRDRADLVAFIRAVTDSSVAVAKP